VIFPRFVRRNGGTSITNTGVRSRPRSNPPTDNDKIPSQDQTNAPLTRPTPSWMPIWAAPLLGV